MKRYGKILSVVLAAAILSGGCGTGKEDKGNEEFFNPDNPVEITLWNYYTGAQQESFDKLVDLFNESKGKELGIVVKAFNEGGVTDLENSVMAAVNEEVGAKELPNIFASYTDTAYKVDQKGMLADLSPYLTEEEQQEYVDSYIEEGQFLDGGSIKIFPVAKATEIFMLNKTDWDKFAESTGAALSDCSTIEGVTETARKYYEWTDSLTDTPDDGRAFFGRDAVANYMIVGAMQLGTEIFAVDEEGNITITFDKDTARKLWDNYYVPYINGHFAAVGRFRSDDIKTGNVISFVGSSSGATFFPGKVILSDDESYDIETEVLPAPKFEDGEDYAVQQGAGMAVTKGSDAEAAACVEFLKWFTDEEQNIEFSIDSGYMPVKKQANDKELIREKIGGGGDVMDVIEIAIDTVNENKLYTATAYEGGNAARNILEYSMSDRAVKDRETIKANIASGMSAKDAVAQYDTDENFEQWYNSTKEDLEKTIE